MHPTETTRRQKIVEAYLAGNNMRKVGKLFGFTVGRIQQILKQEGADVKHVLALRHTAVLIRRAQKAEKRRLHKLNRKTAEARFMEKVRVDQAGCWIWTGAVTPAGYGRFSFGGGPIYAHRFAVEHFNKTPTKGHEGQVGHLCRVRACVNPAHLEVISAQEKVMRRLKSSPPRLRERCWKGHPLGPANTYVTPGKKRLCRICDRARKRAYFARRRS